MTETIKTLLQPIQERLKFALVHAPYKADGVKVMQANNHPSIRPFILAYATAPVIADFIANAPTDQARLLAAVQAVTALHKPRRHDPVMDGVWHGQSDAGQYDLCAHDRQRFPCATVAAIESALTEAS